MTNPFDRLMKDKVFIVNGRGEKTGPFKTAISSKGTATIFDDTIDVEEGYKLLRPLPNGKEDIFTILEANYSPGLRKIPAHYSLIIKKDSSLIQKQSAPKLTTIKISSSQGIQVGDHNIQNITNSIGELIQQIESSNTSPELKSEAKGKIRELITNPTVAAILGGATAGLLALL